MLHRPSLASLPDEALLQSLKAVAARSNQITAVLLQHLAEVEARGAHRLWACPTLQSYCVYELRCSEDEAWRRCRAARLARQFPRLLDMLADSTLHLTGLLLDGPHLTAGNERELLARVAFRTKREIERILAEIAPRPDVPSLVQPLGPAGDGVPRRALGGWTAQVRGIAGFERQLPPGVGPGDAPAVSSSEHGEADAVEAAGEADPAPETDAVDTARDSLAPPDESDTSRERQRSRDDDPNVSVPLRYRVQFTADQDFVDLLAEARDLLWHRLPDGDLASVQRLALEALVAQLRRTKYADIRFRRGEEGATPSRANETMGNAPARATRAASERSDKVTSAAPARARALSHTAPARSDNATSAAPARSPETIAPTTPADPPPVPAPGRSLSTRPRSASHPHLPAELRRDVWRRDGGRCTFVDARGVRCPSTAALEFHHRLAHALGGPSTSANLTLRCRAHNRLAAELDFGAEHVAERVARGALPGPSPSRPP
jgi:hypothetical protein